MDLLYRRRRFHSYIDLTISVMKISREDYSDREIRISCCRRRNLSGLNIVEGRRFQRILFFFWLRLFLKKTLELPELTGKAGRRYPPAGCPEERAASRIGRELVEVSGNNLVEGDLLSTSTICRIWCLL